LRPAADRDAGELRSAGRRPSLDELSSLSNQVAEVYMSSSYEKDSNAPTSASTSEGNVSDIGSESDDAYSEMDSQTFVDDCHNRSLPSRPLPDPGLPPRSPDHQAAMSSRHLHMSDPTTKKANGLVSRWKQASQRLRGSKSANEMSVQDEADAIAEALTAADMALEMHFSWVDSVAPQRLDEDCPDDEESDEQVAVREAEAALELHFQWMEDEAIAAESLCGSDDTMSELPSELSAEESIADSVADIQNECQTQWELEAQLFSDLKPLVDRRHQWYEL